MLPRRPVGSAELSVSRATSERIEAKKLQNTFPRSNLLLERNFRSNYAWKIDVIVTTVATIQVIGNVADASSVVVVIMMSHEDYSW